MKEAVGYALASMRMEGYAYSNQEKVMWAKIASGELPLDAARQDAAEFDRRMRGLYPEKFVKGEV